MLCALSSCGDIAPYVRVQLLLALETSALMPQVALLMEQITGEKLAELPVLVLDAIASQCIGEDLRAWCRLATTCKRLWTLQLPSSMHDKTIDVNPQREKTSAMLFQRA